MRQAATRLVGVILETGHYHAACVLHGVHRYAMERNWQLLVQGTWHHDPLEQWLDRGVDGFVMQATTPELLAFSRCVPVVNVSSLRRDDLLSVSVDHHAVGRLAAEHLLSLPLSHFAFAGNEGYAFAREEGDAFDETIRRAGYRSRRLHCNRVGETVQWLAGLPRPLGLMASSDVYAAHLVRACTIAGVTLKEQVAVIAMGNTPALCDMAIPSLTSVDQRSERIGYEAAEVLDRRMCGEAVVSRRLLPGAVIQRDSTRLRGYDPEIYEALRLIRDTDGLRLSVESLASRLGMERRTLERRFVKVLGRPPREEIRRTRIAKARELLTETELSMPNVALRCGFESATRFGAAFRKETGTTPTAFRKQHREAEA